MNKNILIILFMLLIVPTVVLAQNFEVDIQEIENKIFKDGEAKINLTITNNDNDEQTFKIGIDALWDIMSDPLPDYFSGMVISPGESKSTIIKLSPPSRITVGPKKLNMEITSQTTQNVVTEEITVYIQSTGFESQGYLPFVITTLLVDPIKIDPRGKFTAKIKLKNTNILNLEEVIIDLTTDSNLLNKRRIISLGPLEERTETFTVTLSPLTEPREDVIRATVSTGNTVFTPDRENIEIVSYSEFVDTSVIEKKFLKKKTKIIILNDGNTEGSELYKIKTNSFKSLFTHTTPKTKMLVEGEEKFLVWELVLGASQKIELEYVENYRSLFSLAIISIIVLILYFVLRSPVIVKKKAEVMEIEEGGISKIKITLTITNRNKKSIENVRVIEKVPNIADVVKETYIGTLRPAKILKHDIKGTLIKWNVDLLESFEERMITYKIKSKLSILGALKLSPSVIKFKNQNGRITITHSNSYTLNI